MTKSCIIIGGGFRGMIGAYLLRKRGVAVTLIDKAPTLGGIMYSREWDGFVVDNGVQLFESSPKRLAAIVEEILDGQVVKIDFKYASSYNGVTTAGLAIPDLSHIERDQQAKILYEMVERLPRPPSASPRSLHESLVDRYGDTAAGLLDRSMAHIYGAGSRDLEAGALRQTSFHRLRFLPDDMALELKKHPELDRRLAVMRRFLNLPDDTVSLYPARGGMREFCIGMTRRLRELGVTVRVSTLVTDILPTDGGVTLRLDNGETLAADHLLWAYDYGMLAKTWKKDDRLQERIHNTPMILFHFQVDRRAVTDITYLQQYTPGRLVYRLSAAGVYSNQIRPDQTTYTCAECSARIGDDFWNSPDAFVDRIWEESLQTGFVLPGTPRPRKYQWTRVPVTHRFARVGFSALSAEVDQEIGTTRGAIVMPSQEAFTRPDLLASMEQAAEKVAGA